MEMSLSYDPTDMCSCQERTDVSIPSARVRAWHFTALLFAPIAFHYDSDKNKVFIRYDLNGKEMDEPSAICGCMTQNKFCQDGMHGTPQACFLTINAVVHSRALDRWTSCRQLAIPSFYTQNNPTLILTPLSKWGMPIKPHLSHPNEVNDDNTDPSQLFVWHPSQKMLLTACLRCQILALIFAFLCKLSLPVDQ